MQLRSLDWSLVSGRVGSVSTRNVQFLKPAPGWPLHAVTQRTSPLTTAFAATSEGRFPQRERILRYPDGVERRIRYPQPSYPAISYPAQGGGDTDGVTPDPYRSYAEGEDPTRWENFDVAGLWDQTAPARRADPAQGNDVLDEPGELFAQLTSQDFRRRQQQFWQSVRSSYQIHRGSPWIAPRQVFILALPQPDSDGQAMYTLRTRVAMPAAENELTKVLKRTRADGGHLIGVSEMLDGVVVFQDERSADSFGEMLESDGHTGIGCAQCNSHELFRMVSESRAVVVLCTADADRLPRPEELAAALRTGEKPSTF